MSDVAGVTGGSDRQNQALTEIKEALQKKGKWYPGWLIVKAIEKYVDVIEEPIDKAVTRVEEIIGGMGAEELTPPDKESMSYAQGVGIKGDKPGETVNESFAQVAVQENKSTLQSADGEPSNFQPDLSKFELSGGGRRDAVYRHKTPAGEERLRSQDLNRLNETELENIYFNVFPGGGAQNVAEMRINLQNAFKAYWEQ